MRSYCYKHRGNIINPMWQHLKSYDLVGDAWNFFFQVSFFKSPHATARELGRAAARKWLTSMWYEIWLLSDHFKHSLSPDSGRYWINMPNFNHVSSPRSQKDYSCLKIGMFISTFLHWGPSQGYPKANTTFFNLWSDQSKMQMPHSLCTVVHCPKEAYQNSD